MQPAIQVHWLGVLAAIVAGFFFGWLWYGPLFGRKWAALMGFPRDMKPEPKVMVRGMVLMVVGTFLTAYTLVFFSDVWRPSVWGGSPDAPGFVYAFLAGLWSWLGFYVPTQLSTVAWEGRSWALFGLNTAYTFLNLQLIAMIIAYVR